VEIPLLIIQTGKVFIARFGERHLAAKRLNDILMLLV